MVFCEENHRLKPVPLSQRQLRERGLAFRFSHAVSYRPQPPLRGGRQVCHGLHDGAGIFGEQVAISQIIKHRQQPFVFR